jgi:hypothetical protein
LAKQEQPRHAKTSEVLAAFSLHQARKNVGHSSIVVDDVFTGELLATKDKKSMRLGWARDETLLRVLGGCSGDAVAFSPTGQNIVTGT